MENTLSQHDLAHFAEQGYVRIPRALPADFVVGVQKAIWEHLEQKYGVREDESATWMNGWCGINKSILDKAVKTQITSRLVGAVNQLLGEGQWRPLKTLGGLLMTLPEPPNTPWERQFDWHCDNDPRTYLDGMDELMLFTFYSAVDTHGGGTLILSGSPRLLEQYLHANDTQNRSSTDVIARGFSRWHPFLTELMENKLDERHSTEELMRSPIEVNGITVQVKELTGNPGDAILCHPAMLHAVSKNCSTRPRIMRRTNFRRKRK